MTDFASCHNNLCRFFPNFPRGASIVQVTLKIISSIYIQKLTTTSQYWWCCGWSKFDATTARIEAKLQPALTSSISDCCWHIMHINVANSILYHRVRRGTVTITSWVSILQTTLRRIARRNKSWSVVCVGVWHTRCVVGSFQRDLSYPICVAGRKSCSSLVILTQSKDLVDWYQAGCRRFWQ